MARARRGGSRFRRARRPVDWVTSFAGYNLGQPPAITPPNLNPSSYGLYANGTDVSNVDVGDWSYGQPQYDATVERVRGTLWAWISPNTSWWASQTGRGCIKARIEVVDWAPIGSVWPVQPHDRYQSPQALSVPFSGNVEFMWEHTFLFISSTSWGDLVVDPSNYVQKVDIDVRVRRKVDKGQILALTIGYWSMDYGGDDQAWPDAYVDWELRTLVSQRMR